MPAWCTGALLVYDTTDAESFRRVAKWVEELQVAVRRLKKFHTQLLTFIGFLGSLGIWRALSAFWPSSATSVTCNPRQRFVQQWCYVLVLADPEIVRVAWQARVPKADAETYARTSHQTNIFASHLSTEACWCWCCEWQEHQCQAQRGLVLDSRWEVFHRCWTHGCFQFLLRLRQSSDMEWRPMGIEINGCFQNRGTPQRMVYNGKTY